MTGATLASSFEPTPGAVATATRVLAPLTAALGAVAALGLVLRLTGAQIPLVVQLIPFGISLVLLGVPHGAVDPLVPAWLRARLSPRRSILVVVLLYLLLGGATVLAWLTAPVAAFVFFIASTWFHWGQGDLYIDRLLGQGPTCRVDAVLTVALRGALPMLLPFVLAPAEAGAIFAQTVRAAHPDVDIPVAVLGIAGRIGCLAVVCALAGSQLVVRRAGGRPIARQLVETAVLVLLFCAVPPVLAVGVYFTLWHAARHIIRLELLDARARRLLEGGALGLSFRRFLRVSAPITVAALALLTILTLVNGRPGLGTYLLFIAALTTPHIAVVTWMDVEQRTWSAPSRARRDEPA